MGRRSSCPRDFDAGGVAAPVLTVLLLLTVWASTASAATHPARTHSTAKRPRISLALPPTEVVGSQAVATGAVRIGPRGAGVTLQARGQTEWLNVGRGKVVSGAYRVGFEVPALGSELVLRSLLVKGGRTLAKSPVRTARIVAAGEEGHGTGSGGGAPRPPTEETPPKVEPEGREPIHVTAPGAVVQIGSTVRLAVPSPFKSITALDPPNDSESGLTVASEAGDLAVSASASAVPGNTVLHAAGTGCTETECGLELTVSIPVTVTGLPAPPGPLEEFSEPSPDRIAAAIDDALADELLITLGTPQQPGSRAEAEGDASVVEGVVSGGIDAIGVYEIRWDTPQNLAARRATLEGLPGVAAVSSFTLDEYSADAATPSIAPSYDQPWWTWPYEQIEAGGAWAHASGSDVTIGIIDVGNVFAGHEDLHVAETIPTGTGPEFHATHVAGLACARGDNDLGMTGMASGCPLVSYGVGGLQGLFAHVLEGMTQMANRPAVKVVNISLGENAAQPCETLFEAEQFQAHAQDAAPMSAIFSPGSARRSSGPSRRATTARPVFPTPGARAPTCQT